jgi:hypothetical protein
MCWQALSATNSPSLYIDAGLVSMTVIAVAPIAVLIWSGLSNNPSSALSATTGAVVGVVGAVLVMTAEGLVTGDLCSRYPAVTAIATIATRTIAPPTNNRGFRLFGVGAHAG